MKRAILTALLLIIIIPCLNAQKKEIAQARAFIKSGKDLDKAEQLMRQLLKDSANVGDLKIRVVLAEAVRKQYEQGNEQLYLKQKYDTAALFNLTHKLFAVYEALDSVDAKPDGRGNIKPKYRKKNAEYINSLRPNLFNGGIYFMRNGKFGVAYDMMSSYIDCTRQPIFSGLNLNIGVKEISASYWALFCGYKLKDSVKVVENVELAMKDTARLGHTYRFLAETYNRCNDTAEYVKTLHLGFDRFKTKAYFYTRLLDYYTAMNELDTAMCIVDEALKHDAGNELLLYAKSNILLNAGKYKECIDICDSLIARNDTIADAYYNAGVAYINMAFEKDREKNLSAKERAGITEYYRHARPYMEKYRALCPAEKDRWAAALYNIYLRLNMGKEFEEIDKLLR